MKASSADRRHLVGAILVLGLCNLISGCVGATRLPARSLGPAGAKVEQKEIDLKFLEVGSTQRSEVGNQLAAIDTSYSNPRLFWARWSESRWGYWWVVGMPCNNCMAGDAHRKWHVRNLLVAFDENGIATKKELIGEDKLLWRELRARMVDAGSAPLDLSQPLQISLASNEPKTMALGKGAIDFERQFKGKEVTVQVPVSELVRFGHSSAINIQAPGVTCHVLEFGGNTAYGKKVKFCAEAREIGVLFQYLQQVAPPTMNWE